MINDRKSESTLGERNTDEGLGPQSSDAVTEINPANDDRAIDYGESGQYAPGGRYNQINVNAPDRLDLDEQVDSALRNEKK